MNPVKEVSKPIEVAKKTSAVNFENPKTTSEELITPEASLPCVKEPYTQVSLPEAELMEPTKSSNGAVEPTHVSEQSDSNPVSTNAQNPV